METAERYRPRAEELRQKAHLAQDERNLENDAQDIVDRLLRSCSCIADAGRFTLTVSPTSVDNGRRLWDNDSTIGRYDLASRRRARVCEILHELGYVTRRIPESASSPECLVISWAVPS